MKSIVEQLKDEVEMFLARHDMPPTNFGLLSCRNGHTVFRLRDGLPISSRKIDRIREFMRNYEGNGRARKRRSRISDRRAAA